MSKTPQQVIKNFMQSLDNHNLTINDSEFESLETNDKKCEALALKILDDAVKASSQFTSMQSLIDNFIADCRAYNANDSVNGWNKFLSEKCGIEIALTSDNIIDQNRLKTDDTGAISGSDAGSDVTKTPKTVVPEYGNYYEAETEDAQKIYTGSNGWIVKATAANDTIISSGEDSINAGAGSNFITVQGSSVTIDSSAGNDKISIGSGVKNVTLLDFGDGDSTLGSSQANIVTISSSGQSDLSQISAYDRVSDSDLKRIELYDSFSEDDVPSDSVTLMSGVKNYVSEDYPSNKDDVIVDGVNN